MKNTSSATHDIVIGGGGVAGIHLATKLGRVARWAYLSLCQMHLLSIFGVAETVYLCLANFFAARTRPRLKLH